MIVNLFENKKLIMTNYDANRNRRDLHAWRRRKMQNYSNQNATFMHNNVTAIHKTRWREI